MNTQAELEEARKRLKKASEKKQSEHVRKIYEEAGSDPVLSDYLRQLEQDEHFLPESEPALSPPQEVSCDSGIDFMFPTGQLKSKKKHSKKKHSKKKHSKKKRSKKKRSKKKRSKKRRSRKYIQKGGDTLEYYDEQQLGWVTGEITYNDDGSITVNGNQIECGAYEERLKPNGDFHCWAFLQPNGIYQNIRPRDPSNMTDLLTKWGC